MSESLFHCSNCRHRHFLTLLEAVQHVVSENRGKHKQCCVQDCSKTVPNLRLHIRTFHEELCSLSCSACLEKFVEQKDLNNHHKNGCPGPRWNTSLIETFFEKVDFSCKSTINTFITDELQLNEPSRNAVSEVVKKLCEQLQRTFNVNKFVKGGSIGKGTAVKDKADIDCVIFLNNIKTLEEHKRNLRQTKKRLKSYLKQSKDQKITFDGQTRFAVKFKVRLPDSSREFNVDLLPTFTTDLSREQLYDELIDCATKDYYSAYFVSLQVEFVSGQPSLVKDLIRLVKYWRKTCIEDKSIGKKTRLPSSYPLELITIACWESAGSEEKFDIRAGFKAVLEKLVHYCNIHVIWYKYYDEALAERGIKGTIKSKPFVLDPANPTNNVCIRNARDVKGWRIVAAVATMTLQGNRVKSDLERIIKHGLRANDKIDKNNIKLIELCQATVPENAEGFSGDEESFTYKALLDCCLSSSNLLELVNNRMEQLQYLYQEFAFLRSAPHVKAMLTCMQAFEKGDFQLLGKIDNVLLNKKKYIEGWLQDSAYFHAGLLESSVLPDHIQGKPGDELSSSNSTDSSSEKEDFQRLSLYGSPEDSQIEITDYSVYRPAVLLQENIELYPSESGQNFSYLPRNDDLDPSSEIRGKSASRKDDTAGEGNNVTLPSQRLKSFRPSKIGHNVKATLAYAALSAVTESEETATCPGEWFDGHDEDQFHKPRRASTGSLNENLVCPKSETISNNGLLETSILPTHDKYVSSSSESVTDHQIRKGLGHTRSKSDQVGVPKFHKQKSVTEVTRYNDFENQDSFRTVSRLSSSLPSTSESLYCNDPYLEDPYQEQSLATILASQDFSSCELDKENAHFSISEALIAAIEQMKCDDVNSSDEEEDEEILHLKEELERKRREKKQGKHLLEQAAFSDETTQSSTSEPGTWTNSSRSACDSEDDLSPEWEEISPSDKQLQEYDSDLSTSSVTLASVAHLSPPSETTDVLVTKLSTQLSAEIVAKSLLEKFSNRKHPAASELQWLVSFQDAPQSLLPLPEAVAVAPDDVLQVEAFTKKPLSKQDSLPYRIRGNSEWAPPRAQIIFHAHKPPRRKALMAQQNFRCAGCGMAVAPDYMKRFRYCHYLGKYFCSTCHSNILEVIPARVVRKWDFTKYEVSNFARDLLNRIHFDPLFNLMDLNPSLYKRFRVLEGLKDIRRRLHFLKSFVQTCRKANELAEEFSKLPDHICRDTHLYSIHDLLQAHNGDLLLFLRKLAIESLNHINHCQLCLAKGFICEYCKNGDDVIFPFQLNRVIQCSGCHASFHKDCFVEGKCPKCERIRIRKQLLSQSVSPEEECSTENGSAEFNDTKTTQEILVGERKF